MIERRTLVAVSRDAIAAGALLHRFGGDERVGKDFRNAGEIRWLVCRYAADEAGDALIEACLETMDEWQVDRQYAAGELPSLAAYGVPDCWPHIRALYLRHGFVRRGHVEIILVASLDDLPTGLEPPLPGLTMRRSVGPFGARFSGVLDEEVVGYIDVEVHTDGDPRARASIRLERPRQPLRERRAAQKGCRDVAARGRCRLAPTWRHPAFAYVCPARRRRRTRLRRAPRLPGARPH